MTTTLLIGAGPGLGRSIALAFAAGGPVTLVARDADRLDAIADEVHSAGAHAVALAADVGDETGLRTALASSVQQLGTPDVLVYNAAMIQQDSVGQISAAEHERAWGVNVVGALTAVGEIAPLMEHRGSGTILLTGGMPAPDPDYISLSLGKAGLRALTQLLAERYGPAGVHVATITVAGSIGTEIDPDDIAAHYLRLHAQQPSEWEREVVLRPGH